MNKRDYLFQCGAIASGDPEKIKAASLEFDKTYHREFQKAYRKKRKRIELYLKVQDFVAIEKLAKAHDQKVSAYVRSVLMEQLGKYQFIPNAKLIDQLITEIKRVGNNLNQLARYAHSERDFKDWERIRIELTALEKTLIKELTEPKDTVETIRQAVITSRITVQQLMEIFQDINQEPP